MIASQTEKKKKPNEHKIPERSECINKNMEYLISHNTFKFPLDKRENCKNQTTPGKTIHAVKSNSTK